MRTHSADHRGRINRGLGFWAVLPISSHALVGFTYLQRECPQSVAQFDRGTGVFSAQNELREVLLEDG